MRIAKCDNCGAETLMCEGQPAGYHFPKTPFVTITVESDEWILCGWCDDVLRKYLVNAERVAKREFFKEEK